ncbi:hypothetical protein HRbin20_01795 [bacterium HR20]|nr:hypothetical protein HRbin20_01795 [bacterium HR20]
MLADDFSFACQEHHNACVAVARCNAENIAVNEFGRHNFLFGNVAAKLLETVAEFSCLLELHLLGKQVHLLLKMLLDQLRFTAEKVDRLLDVLAVVLA